MRRLAVVLVLGACAALAAPAGAQSGEARLTPDGDDAFPSRSWVLTLPDGRSAQPDEVRVSEDGRDVRDLEVVDADLRRSGVVHVLDASGSMEGEAIEDAMEAARAFAARRPAGQALGVVTFNGEPTVVLAPTTDEARIDAALARPPELGPDTSINDAVAGALALLRQSRLESGSVVVLSDGDDNASRRTVAEVTAAAKGQGVRVFGIGLESGAFSPGSLRRLSEESNGTYSLASSSGSLRGAFDALGAQLAEELVITYRSVEPAGSEVRIVATVGDGSRATATYRAPDLGVAAAPNPTPPGGFWISSAGIAATAVTIGLLLAIAMGLVVRAPRRQRLRERLAPFGPVTEDAGLPDVAPDSWLEEAYQQLQSRLATSGWWQRFAEEVDVARAGSPVALAVRTGLLAVVALVLGVLTGAGVLIGIALAAAVLFCARVYVNTRLKRQRLAFADQLADSLQVMASALRAGHSLAGALASVVDDAPEPTRAEFARIRADERLGVPIEDSITRVARRMDNKDLEQVGIVAKLQHETGGNTAEVLDRVVENVRERGELRRLVRTLTAQGRLGQVVVTLLPIGIGGYIFLVNRPYLDPLFEPGAGRIMLIAAIVMTALGSLAIKKIVDIKV